MSPDLAIEIGVERAHANREEGLQPLEDAIVPAHNIGAVREGAQVPAREVDDGPAVAPQEAGDKRRW